MYDPNVPPPPPGMMQTMGAPAQSAQWSPRMAALPLGGHFANSGGQAIFGPGFDPRGYMGQIRSWLDARPSDTSGLTAWRNQMPSPFGAAQPATPAGPAQAPYPVTQLPNPVNPATQIAPAPQGASPQPVGAPQPFVPEAQRFGSFRPAQPPAPGSGFFGRRGR